MRTRKRKLQLTLADRLEQAVVELYDSCSCDYRSCWICEAKDAIRETVALLEAQGMLDVVDFKGRRI